MVVRPSDGTNPGWQIAEVFERVPASTPPVKLTVGSFQRFNPAIPPVRPESLIDGPPPKAFNIIPQTGRSRLRPAGLLFGLSESGVLFQQANVEEKIPIVEKRATEASHGART